MMNELKKNELTEQEVDSVTGGASLGDLFGVVADAVSSAWDTVADAAGTVVDVVEYAVEHGRKQK